ncbi:MAG: hypothetical protein IPL55_24145 [Saprospiraceae bacterium]|nr:hypothetical protein [Saprospiraceae bacterium]
MDTTDHYAFGILSRCDSMGEICDGMMGMQGKLNHLGLKSSPARSTAGDGLRERDNVFLKSCTLNFCNILSQFCRSAALIMYHSATYLSLIRVPLDYSLIL